MNFKIVDGVKKRTTPTPSKRINNTIETSIITYYICFFKYINCWIIANNIGGGLNG